MQLRPTRRASASRPSNSRYITRQQTQSMNSAGHPFGHSSTPAKKSSLCYSHLGRDDAMEETLEESFVSFDSSPEISGALSGPPVSPPSYELEYRQETLKVMRSVAQQTMPVLAALQAHLSQEQWRERAHAIDFIINVHSTLDFSQQTLYLAVNIMNRYLSHCAIPDGSIHLILMVSWWISAKFTESKGRVPTLANLMRGNQKQHTRREYLALERSILQTLDHRINHPTCPDWLAIAFENSDMDSSLTQAVAHFLMEFSMYFQEYLEVLPSSLAEASLYLARVITTTLPFSCHDDEQSFEIASCLDRHLSLHGRNNSVFVRYSREKYHCASVVVANWYEEGNTFKDQCDVLGRGLSPEKLQKAGLDSYGRHNVSRATSQTPSLSFASTASSVNSPNLSEYSLQTPGTPCPTSITRAVAKLQKTAQVVQATRALKMSLRSHTALQQATEQMELS